MATPPVSQRSTVSQQYQNKANDLYLGDHVGNVTVALQAWRKTHTSENTFV